MGLKAFGIAAALTLALLVPGSVADRAELSAQGAAQSQPVKFEPVPALGYICPMVVDSDVWSDKPGKCPKCGMALTPARITAAFGCLKHDAILREQPGACPIDRSELMPMVVAVSWACADKPGEKLMSPGTCADGKEAARRLEKRPHADHNPRHGGQLFMADTGWHHVEGTLPREGLFRAYFYDELTKPMAVSGFTARAVVTDAAGKEIESFTLTPGPMGNTLEGTLKTRNLPLRISLKVRFKPDDKERPFDFTFAAFTQEPGAGTPSKSGAASVPAQPLIATSHATPLLLNPRRIMPIRFSRAQQAPTSSPQTTSEPATTTGGQIAQPTAGADVGNQLELMPSQVRIPLELPDNTKELLVMLDGFAKDVQTFIDEGSLGQVWKPTFDVKDVALGLGDRLKEVPANRRLIANEAVRQIVLSSWEIDAFADLGDKQKVTRAHTTFKAAIDALKSAYGSKP